MKKNTQIKIISAEWVGGYNIKFTFSDGKVNVFDYTSVVMWDHEESIPYQNIEKFKKFQIIGGGTEIAWGKNWNMILPLDTIYSKKKVSFSGRKKVEDKKVPVTIYLNKSTIKEYGGLEIVREDAAAYITGKNIKK